MYLMIINWGLQLCYLPFEDKWIQHKDQWKKGKEICEAVAASMLVGLKTLHFFVKHSFVSCSFYVDARLLNKNKNKKKCAYRLDWRKREVILYNNFKEGEGSKAGEFNASKDGLIILEQV